MRAKVLASFLFVSTLLSCDSDSEKDIAPAPAPEPIKTFDFSFRYDTEPEGAKKFELFVSNKDGEVLLDTLIAFNTDHSLSVISEDTKHDLTTILIDPTDNSYWMETFFQVNPDKWHLRYRSGGSSTSVEFEKADITYTNVPNTVKYHFKTKGITNYGGGYSGSLSGNTLTLEGFKRLLPTDLAYIVLPSHGKYLFTELTSNQTTVDFSQAGNTEKRKYNKPANVTYYATYLTGYTKAGDLKSNIHLYWSSFYPSEEYDLQFPPTVIEEFDLNVTYNDANGYNHSYRSFGKEVPTEIDFSPISDFTVSKSGFEDFVVTFTNDKPSIFTSYWGTDDASIEARWTIHSSPDQTNYKPKAFLEGLKSKKLADKDLSVFKLLTATSSKVNDYSYLEYIALRANSNLFLSNGAIQQRTIRKSSF